MLVSCQCSSVVRNVDDISVTFDLESGEINRLSSDTDSPSVNETVRSLQGDGGAVTSMGPSVGRSQ